MTSVTNQPLEFSLRVDSAFERHIGKRKKNNEDFAASYEPNDPNDLRYSGCLYIVADGVTGASRGEKASQYATKKVMYEYYRYPELSPEERLKGMLRKVGEEIIEYVERNDLRQMATTMVAAVVRGNKLTVANVGDSRLYLIRNGVSHQITVDHTQAEDLRRSGAITPAEAKHSKAKHILSRSIGGHEDAVADIFSDIELYPGDIFVLCSDGLHQYLDNTEIAALVNSQSPIENAKNMVDFANRSGGSDNITALVVHIHSSQEPFSHPHVSSVPASPESLDTMRTETHNWRSKENGVKRYQWAILLFALPVLMLAVTLGIFGGQILSALLPAPTITPTSTPEIAVVQTGQQESIENEKLYLPGITSPSAHAPSTENTDGYPPVESTLSMENPLGPQPEDSTYPVPSQPITEPNLSVTPTPAEKGSCMHEILDGQGVILILNYYSIEFSADKTYYVYQSCDSEKSTCTGKEEKIPPDHFLDVNKFLFIEEVKSKDECVSQNGLWINTLE